jgi:hypothetical protein
MASNKFGFHRVVDGDTTPQAAEKLDVTLATHDDTVIDVFLLNLDSTSATQLHNEAKEKNVQVSALIRRIVETRGKVSVFFFFFLKKKSLSSVQDAQSRDQFWRRDGWQGVSCFSEAKRAIASWGNGDSPVFHDGIASLSV